MEPSTQYAFAAFRLDEDNACLWHETQPVALKPKAFTLLHHLVRHAGLLVTAVVTLTTERPLVLVLEDLHWSDASTLEWLSYVARRRQPARLLVLGTYRPVDAIVREHSVRTMTHELLVRGQCHEVVVDYLSETQVRAYLTLRFGMGPHGATLAPLLQQRTNGNPLFLVTIVEEMVRQGVLHEGATGWELSADADAATMAAPESVQHLIAQQFAQLPREAQALFKAASIMGKEFTVVPVAAALECPPEEVEEQCTALARRGQWIRAHGTETWPDETVTARFAFLHDLYRETAYVQLPMSRQARWHQQIGLCLEHGYGDKAREIAAELADHFVRGREASRAVQYLRYAADNALRRSSYPEAITYLRRGLRLVTTLPETPQHLEHQLSFLVTLGTSLQATLGWAAPEVEEAYTAAQGLCEQVGETPQRGWILSGLSQLYMMRGALVTARTVGEQLVDWAQGVANTRFSITGHMQLGMIYHYLGEGPAARGHLEQALRYADVHKQHWEAASPRIISLSHLAWSLWGLGYPDRALRTIEHAVRSAQDLALPILLIHALRFRIGLHQFRCEWRLVLEQVAEAEALCHEQEFVQYLSGVTTMHGWALIQQGHHAAGMARLQQGLAAWRSTGSQLIQPYFLALLAEAYGITGQPDIGLSMLHEALAMTKKSREHWYEAELYRLQGELLQQQEVRDVLQAERCFNQAPTIARHHEAKSLELRAAQSLCRLWQQQGKRQEAYDLLASVYEWFTEGFDTPDLQQAQALLAALH